MPVTHPFNPGDTILCRITGRPLLVVRCERSGERYSATHVIVVACYRAEDVRKSDGSVTFPTGVLTEHPEDPKVHR